MKETMMNVVTNCREVETANHETLHLLPHLDLLPRDGGCGVQTNDLDLVLAADDGKLDALLASAEFRTAEEVFGLYVEGRADDGGGPSAFVFHSSTRRLVGRKSARAPSSSSQRPSIRHDAPPSLDALLAAMLDAHLAPLRVEIQRLAGEVEGLRRALPPMLVSPTDAAERLKVSLPTVRRAMKRGDLPVVKVGKLLRIDLAALRGPSDEDIALGMQHLRTVTSEP